jgi:hypothetical protein
VVATHKRLRESRNVSGHAGKDKARGGGALFHISGIRGQ